MGVLNDFEETAEGGSAKDIAIVLSSALATTVTLKGVAGYKNAVDPQHGIPRWKVGLDLGVAAVGLVGALVLDDGAALASLGMSLAGACSVAGDYATVGGAYLAHALGKAAPSEPAMQPAPVGSPAAAVKGNEERSEVTVGRAPMNPKQKSRYDRYAGR